MPPPVETLNLIALSMVRGADVYDLEGGHLGVIDDVALDRDRGHVAHVLLSIGSVLGFGGDRARLDWRALKYDRNLKGYVTGQVVPALQAAPDDAEEDAEEDADTAGMAGARLA